MVAVEQVDASEGEALSGGGGIGALIEERLAVVGVADSAVTLAFSD